MIRHIKYDELLSITKELDGMLAKHVEWLTLLQKTIICDLPSLPSLLKQHRTCDFGRWYYSVTLPMVIESPDFMRLGVIHKDLHTIAIRILEQYESNRVVEEKEYDLFVDHEKQFFNTFNRFIENVLATKSQFDYLTNIPNRNLITLILEKEHSKITRKKSESCLAFADIDHFKHVNDTYGHEFGDKVLTEVSKYFSANIRPYDTVGRYGGEEFIFCFPEIDLNSAKGMLERVRRGIEELSIRTDDSSTIKVTCSFGLSNMCADNSLTEIIKQADNAMYMAKNNGRNRVKVCDCSKT